MSGDTMTFSSGSWDPTTNTWTDAVWSDGTGAPTSLTINRPLHEYTAEIHMPIETIKSQIGDWHFFDNDASGSSDYRLCTMNLELPVIQKQDLNDWIRLDNQGRALPFKMYIDSGLSGAVAGDASDGFYPFGPDLYAVGNSGDTSYSCIVQPVQHEQGGALWQPFRWFEDKLTLLLVSPVSALPVSSLCSTGGQAQGPLSFGMVSGLMFPQDGFKPKPAYNYDIGVSLAGVPGVVDAVTDYYETSFEVAANLGNAAALISMLTGITGTSGRANSMTFYAVSNGSQPDPYPFGIDNPSGEEGFSVHLLGAEKKDNEIVLKITHESYNRFRIPLTLSKAA